MIDERWKRVEDLLHSALALPLERRSEFLRQACGGDASLLDEIQSLLTSARRAGDFLENPALEVEARSLAASEQTHPPEALPADLVPHYRILRLLGSGGMGSVWLAERSDGRFERRVAIKFIHLSMTGPASAQRFRREGSILGKLVHPHIAELIDAGVTARGEPYLVLEYVEGRPIDEYCDAQGLGVAARIRIFLDVLSALSHAHANLIVHRDIKPTNVFVRGDGQVKLLDFGVAKLLTDETGPDSGMTLTRDGGSLLTPRFAAPEQVMEGAITTATDVYAAGLLLYLLLTGQHATGRGGSSPSQLLRAVVEEEAGPPSEAIRSDDFEIARRRASTPDRLRRQLRGDLDTILGKALKKDPAERYPSVSALADDLGRRLAHQPIGARPDSLAYRAARFVRRNRMAVALASLVVAVSIAGIAGILLQAHTTKVERDFAVRQLARVEAINELNTVVLGEGYQSPEMLDRAEKNLAEQHKVSPADRVEVLITLALSADISIDGGARSKRLLEQAYRLSRDLADPSTRARAACAMAGQVSYGAEAARSEAYFQEGLKDLPERAEFALDRVFCLRAGGAVSRAQGAGAEAISRLQLAQRFLKEAPIPSWRLEFLTSNDLGTALRLAGRYREACAQFERIAARMESEGAADTAPAAQIYYGWGLTLSSLGRPLEAEKLIHRAIVMDNGSEDAPDALPWELNSHAKVLRDLGRLDEAATLAERGYAGSLKNGDGARVNQALLLRASIYRMRGELPRAEEMLSELEPRGSGLPPGNIFFASLLSEKAQLALARGDTRAALDLMNQAVPIAQASVKAGQLGADLVPVLLTYLSDMERQLGRDDEAITTANQALGRIEETAQPGTFSVLAGRAYLALGRAFQAQKKDEEARADFRLAAEHLEKALGRDSLETHAALQLASPPR